MRVGVVVVTVQGPMNEKAIVAIIKATTTRATVDHHHLVVVVVLRTMKTTTYDSPDLRGKKKPSLLEVVKNYTCLT
jgi:hypothetical protein